MRAGLVSMLLVLAAFSTGCVGTTEASEPDAVAAEDELASRACQTRRETPSCTTTAVIEQVFIGEVDPVVIGDACIVFAREAGGKLLGLVEDPGSCLATPALVGKEGARIRFHRGDVLRISRPSLRNGLRAYRADAAYYDLLGPAALDVPPTP